MSYRSECGVVREFGVRVASFSGHNARRSFNGIKFRGEGDAGLANDGLNRSGIRQFGWIARGTDTEWKRIRCDSMP